MNLCINCIHFTQPYNNSALTTCEAPQNKTIDPVTGKTRYTARDCYSHREGFSSDWLSCRFNDRCGAEGRWFKPKTKEVTV